MFFLKRSLIGLDLGKNGITYMEYEKNKLGEVKYFEYLEGKEEIENLKNTLEKINDEFKIRNKEVIVTLPSLRFYTKFLRVQEDDINLQEGLKNQLEDLILGYKKEDFITEIEMVDNKNKEYFAVAINLEEIGKIIGILDYFKLSIRKIIPRFIGINNLVEIVNHQENMQIEDVQIISIYEENSEFLVSSSGVIKFFRKLPFTKEEIMKNRNEFIETIEETVTYLKNMKICEIDTKTLLLSDIKNLSFSFDYQVMRGKILGIDLSNISDNITLGLVGSLIGEVN
jgi:hypothetical protein